MSKTIVSIISDHLLPNFLFIKEMDGQYDHLLFISTHEMEDKAKSADLEHALRLPEGSVPRIVVENDNYHAILSAIKATDLPSSEEYIVNLTGGTKSMSVAAHRYFGDLSAQFVYVPIGKNSYYEFSSNEIKPLRYRVDIDEYFTLYGISFEYDNSLVQGEHRPFVIFDQLRRRRFFLTDELKDAHTAPTPALRSYLSGGWFEEYTYLRIKKDYHLDDRYIAKSAKIYRPGSVSNELDVVFVKDNTLYVIECKVTMFGYGKVPKEVVEEYLYKLAAVSSDFGLRVHSFLFTLHRMDRLPEETLRNLKKRSEILKIRDIVDGRKLIKPLIL